MSRQFISSGSIFEQKIGYSRAVVTPDLDDRPYSHEALVAVL
ncbi:hypothetical protein [Komarekiella delphini-convector]|nr:hypothetical protein [Komarekiella delphini-convector]